MDVTFEKQEIVAHLCGPSGVLYRLWEVCVSLQEWHDTREYIENEITSVKVKIKFDIEKHKMQVILNN